MNYLSIDYGEKHLGLAYSEGIYATGLETIGIKELDRLKKICHDNKIEQIVIGLPEGRLYELVKQFGTQINKITGIPVDFIDETLSSYKAQQILQMSNLTPKNRRQKEHAFAAIEILERYLENKK